MTILQINQNTQEQENIGTGIKCEMILNLKRKNLLRLVLDHGKSIKDAADVLKINCFSARILKSMFKKRQCVEILSRWGRSSFK